MFKYLRQIYLNNIHAYNRLKNFKGKSRFLNYLLEGIDVLTTVFAAYLAIYTWRRFFNPELEISWQYYLLGGFMLFTWGLLIKVTNLPKIPRTTRYRTIFFEFARITLIGIMILMVFKFVFVLRQVDLAVIFIFGAYSMFFLFLVRIATFGMFKISRVYGYNMHNVIVVADAFSDEFIEKLLSQKEWGFRILMIVTNSKLIRAKFGDQIKIISEKANLRALIDVDIIDEVIYCKNRIDFEKVKNLVTACEEVGVIFRMQSDLSPLSSANVHLETLHEMPYLTFIDTPTNHFYLTLKMLSDLYFSIIMLLMFLPFLGLIALLIKIDSKGPVFFKQERVGLRGRKFYMYKFRTMVQDAEKLKEKLMDMNQADGPVFKIKDDPRITKLGRFLRKSGLDEIPQLINVVRGEMSLIGPRPPIPKEVEQYKRWQIRRLSVKPGITCSWQIIPNRNDVLFEKWMKLDLQYIDNWSIKLDFLLLFKTIKTVFGRTGN